MGKWTFVCAADMQPGSPKSFRYNPSFRKNWEEARRQIIEAGPELMLVPGDITRDGSIHDFEFEEMKKDFQSLPFPVYVVPGNMDTGNKCTSLNGPPNPNRAPDTGLNITPDPLRRFSKFFGPLWWSREHKGIRFSGFADVVVNSGLPEEDEFWKWAEERKESGCKHHVWILHYPLFWDSPEEPDWDITDPELYRRWYFTIDRPGRERLIELFKATGADIVISGHTHCMKKFTLENIVFQVAPATGFGQEIWGDGDKSLGFLKYDVDGSSISETFVPLRKKHDLPGYGPGGHPPAHMRDYSLAWEK